MKGLLVALLVCVALAARGETISVRSGEHDGFTRLVLAMAAPAAWQFGRTLDGYELRLGRPDVRFDLSGVFDRIPRLRLADLGTAAEGTRLTLQLSCACHAKVFEFRPTILVIDIRPGPPPANSPFERPVENGDRAQTAAAAPAPFAPPPRPRSRPQQTMPVYDWRANAPSLSPGPDGGAAAAPAVGRTAAGAAPQVAPAAPAVGTTAAGVAPQVAPAAPAVAASASPPPDPTDPHLAAARSELVQQLGRAASQGLLSADPAAFGPDPAPEPEAPAPSDVPPPANPPPDGMAPAPRLRAQTALDREVLIGQGAPVTPSGGVCLPDPLFDLRQWGDNRPVTRQIAARRATLVGEFDRPSPTDVGALMRLYLYLGFGAEARALPGGMQVEVPDGDLLVAMGDILEEGRARNPGRLAGQTGCSGAVALWSVLADPAIAPGATVDVDAVVRGFSALPLPLRRLLGPGLSGRFLASGDIGTARTIRDAITRAPGAAGDAVDLLGARIDLADGKTGAAEATIRRVAASDGATSPDALVLLVGTQVANGGTVDSATIESIAALAHQFRGTATGRSLARAHLLALGLAGDFDGAFRELAALRAAPDTGDAGADTLWALLAAQGSDEALLRHGLNVRDAPEAARKTHVMLARRLVDLGFPGEGQAWLAAFTPMTDQERLLAARARLALGDAAGITEALGGLGGGAAAGLRAAADALAGDHAAAEAAYLAAGARSDAGAEAWRAGDWATVRTIGRPEQQAAVGATVAPSGPVSSPTAQGAAAQPAGAAPAGGPLAQARALVDDSVKVRGVLQALLASTPVPPPAAP